MTDPTERFSERATHYARYRPAYPPAVFALIDALAEREPLPRVAADLGAGTGLFTSGLLHRGWAVHAIEPNARMRREAERTLGGHPGFVSHPTTAEDTGLADASVGMVAAAQAFHWFDLARCSVEWPRILVPRGLVCLAWNVRRLGTPFMDAYDALLSRGLPEYEHVTGRHDDSARVQRFLTGGCETVSIPHHQTFDWDGLVGRVLSSSYAPTSADPEREPLFARLRALFDAHQQDGVIDFLYDARVTIGRFRSSPSQSRMAPAAPDAPSTPA